MEPENRWVLEENSLPVSGLFPGAPGGTTNVGAFVSKGRRRSVNGTLNGRRRIAELFGSCIVEEQMVERIATLKALKGCITHCVIE